MLGLRLRPESLGREVVPGTARKVLVYPADGTPTELLGVLRSDQAEAFHRGDAWYMYWAGRYATAKHRLGPYIFHSDLGASLTTAPSWSGRASGSTPSATAP